MTSDAVVAIQSVLVPGEHVLWSGRPGFRFRRGEVIGGAFAAVLALMFALAAPHGAFGVVFAVLLAAAALSGLMLEPWDRATLAYCVTDQRVLFVHRSWRRSTDEYALSGMSAANVVLGGNSVGFADFAKRCGYDNDEICMPDFLGLPDAWDVVQLIRAAVTATGGTPRWT